MTEDYNLRAHWRAADALTVSAAQAAAGTLLQNGPGELVGWSLSAGSAITSSDAEARVVAPGAGATITSVILPQGTWLIKWTVELDGAAAAADLNNFKLNYGGANPLNSLNPAAAGTYPQQDQTTIAGAGTLTVSVQAIGAGTAGVGYSASITAIPTSDAFGSILDGGQLLAVISLSAGASDTQGPGSRGIRFDNSVAVSASVGQLSGVLYVADLVDPSGGP
jgi:hypothetical protein